MYVECRGKAQAEGLLFGKYGHTLNQKVLRSLRNILPSKTQLDMLQVLLFKMYLY